MLPEDLSVRRTLTELYQRLGLTERVLEQRYQLACHYLAQKDVDTAAELLEQVLNEHPSHNPARRVLLDVYLAQGRI